MIDDDHTRLRAELDALAERVTALEQAAAAGHADPGRARSDPAQPDHPPAEPAVDGRGSTVIDEETFWALEGLRRRLPDHPDTVTGAVMLVGSLTLPDGAPVAWQQAGATAGLLETDWSDRAAAFAALGHPVRLELLRRLLSGVSTTAELADTEGLATTGQLHHHLRQLVAAGWVRQVGRGRYEVPAARVVPLLASLVGAER